MDSSCEETKILAQVFLNIVIQRTSASSSDEGITELRQFGRQKPDERYVKKYLIHTHVKKKKCCCPILCWGAILWHFFGREGDWEGGWVEKNNVKF